MGFLRARRTSLGLATLIGFALLAFGAISAQAASTSPARSSAGAGTATVTLVHGVRGLLADVVVDGKTVLKGFAYERASSPLTLPAGTHRVQVYAAGQPHTTALLDVPLTVKSGQIITAAVGFSSTGAPKVFLFDDRLSAATHSVSSIVVRNVSQGSSPELLVDGHAVKSALAPGAQAIDAVKPGSHTVGLKVNGAWLLTNQPVKATAGDAMVVYIVGKQSATSIALVANQVRPVTAAAATAAVDSGGRAPSASSPVLPIWLSLCLVLFGLALTATLVRGRRRRLPAVEQRALEAS